MKRGMLLLLCAAMITGLYTDKAYAEDMLTYDLRADRTVYYTAQSAGGPITLTVPMYIAHDPGTVGINAAFRVDAPLEITGLTLQSPIATGTAELGAIRAPNAGLCHPSLPSCCGIPPITVKMRSSMTAHGPLYC